jgi:hypothetical protein
MDDQHSKLLNIGAVSITAAFLLGSLPAPVRALDTNRAPETTIDASKLPRQQAVPIAPSSAAALSKVPVRAVKLPPGLTILQIGDSHTAADYFTGEIRRILQERYGDGGPGYFVVGTPHIGVRHTLIKSALSAGWTYAALQKSAANTRFSLAGFSTTAMASHETIRLSAESEMPYDLIEIETSAGPDRGAIDVALDNVVCLQRKLRADHEESVVLQLTAAQCKRSRFETITITTTEDGPVTLDGIGIFAQPSGLTYSNVGFPGAKVDIINKFDANIFTNELRRLAPQIVVLAFGTNEGFKDDIDLDEYRDHYLEAIHRIRVALPAAKLVMILPSDAARLSAPCQPEAARAACQSNQKPPPPRDAGKEPSKDKETNKETGKDPDKDPSKDPSKEPAKETCFWRKPPQLDRIRDIERDIAQQAQIPTWDWSKLMPKECGAHIWSTERHLMARDHVHFTQDGYRFSAAEFVKFLRPIVDAVKSRRASTLRN